MFGETVSPRKFLSAGRTALRPVVATVLQDSVLEPQQFNQTTAINEGEVRPTLGGVDRTVDEPDFIDPGEIRKRRSQCDHFLINLVIARSYLIALE